MTERITSIEIKTKLSNGPSLKFQAFTFDPTVVGDSDGKVLKATGLEAPSLDVLGGSASYGGSVYTGIRANDREVVLTVKPVNTPVKRIKNVLGALASWSMTDPLELRLNTIMAGGTETSLFGDAYVVGVSAPIFEADDKIQITIKMPRPEFQRTRISWTGEGDVPLTLASDQSLGGKRMVLYTVNVGEVGYDVLNAPSPFAMLMNMDKAAAIHLDSIATLDMYGNQSTQLIVDPWSMSGVHSNSDLYVEYNGQTRQVNPYMQYQTQTPVSLRGLGGYTNYVSPSWPRLRPGAESITIMLTFRDSHTSNTSQFFRVKSFHIYARVFGL